MDRYALPGQRQTPQPLAGQNLSQGGIGAAMGNDAHHSGGFGTYLSRFSDSKPEGPPGPERPGRAEHRKDNRLTSEASARDKAAARKSAEMRREREDLSQEGSAPVCLPNQADTAQVPRTGTDSSIGSNRGEAGTGNTALLSQSDGEGATDLSAAEPQKAGPLSASNGQNDACADVSAAFAPSVPNEGARPEGAVVAAPTDGRQARDASISLIDGGRATIGTGDATPEPGTTDTESTAEISDEQKLTSATLPFAEGDSRNSDAGTEQSPRDSSAAQANGSESSGSGDGFARAFAVPAGQGKAENEQASAGAELAAAASRSGIESTAIGDSDAMLVLPSGHAMTTQPGVVAAMAGGQHASADLAATISRQIAGMAGASSENSVALLLSPEELGRVAMTLSTKGDGISVALLIDRPETLELMRRHIEILTRDLRELGFAHVDVSFGNATQDPQDEAAQHDSPQTEHLSAGFAKPPTMAPQVLALAPSTGLDLRL